MKKDLPGAGWSDAGSEKPEVGQSASRVKTVTFRDVRLFSEITGDRNPLHYNKTAARSSPFGGLIVQTGVISGLVNAVVAEDLPGPGSILLSAEWTFVRAVRIGETITATVEIISVRDDAPICRLRATVRNQGGEACLHGAATSYTASLEG